MIHKHNYGLVQYITDYDDGSVTLTQSQTDELSRDSILHFGPLSETLNNLILDGFTLTVRTSTNALLHKNRVKIQIVRGNQRYKVGYLPVDIVKDKRVYDICAFLSKNLYINPQTHVTINEPINPWDKLKGMYPKPVNDLKMIGNNTVDEYVRKNISSSSLEKIMQ